MLFLYFVFIKGKISSYSLISETENFILDDSSLLLTNGIDILNFVKVRPKENQNINSIELYYKNKNDKTKIFKGSNDNYYIEELPGYKEYQLDNIPNSNLYIEINYDDNKTETMKVFIKEKFINNNIFIKKNKEISKDKNKDTKESTNFINKITKEGFKNKEGIYEKELNKYAKIYYTEPDTITISSKKDGIIENFNCHLKYDDIIEQKMYPNGKFEINYYKIEESLEEFNSNTKIDTNHEYILYISYLKQFY